MEIGSNKTVQLIFFQIEFSKFISRFRRMPFDWKSPLTFLAAASLQIVALYFILLSSYCFLCFLIGFCWTIILFSKDIVAEVRALDDVAKENSKKLTKIKSKLIDIIQFHSKAKQLSCYFYFGKKNRHDRLGKIGFQSIHFVQTVDSPMISWTYTKSWLQLSSYGAWPAFAALY